MREICDKHFPDNWVIPIYGGVLVDLVKYWASWPAAKKALSNNIVLDKVQSLSQFHQLELTEVSKRLGKYIIEGQLREKEALDNIKDLMATLRDANATIRWIVLHQNAQVPQMRQIVDGVVKEELLVNLLLDLSKFEYLMKELLHGIVKKKNKMWTKDKEQCTYYMEEVSEFFAGNRNWGGEHTDQDLSEYFKRIAATITEFEYRHTTKVGRKIQKLMLALEDL